MEGKTLKITYEKLFWQCECCGSGYHSRITVGENVFSHDDQFGGPLNHEEDIDCGYDGDKFVSDLVAALTAAKISFEYVEEFEEPDYNDHDD